MPNPNDPQAPPGSSTLSLFRRPLVNTNVHFDSAVLWDGRASIDDMRSQVQKAARTLLLAGGPSAGALGDVSDADADEVAAFMLGIFTAPVVDDDAGKLYVRGATGGVADLAALSSDPAAPCTPLAPDTCTPVVRGNPQTMTLFDAWANVPDHGRNGINGSARPTEGRAAVVRGEALFNRLNCPGCHATNNVGNNPSETFLIRLGVDSPDTLAGLAAADTRVDRLLERVRMLPEYCLRPAGSTSDSPCGDEVGDATTTDPGRALVTGRIADVGKFKPPILRGLAIRAPFFHNAAAETLDDLVNFYNAKFQTEPDGRRARRSGRVSASAVARQAKRAGSGRAPLTRACPPAAPAGISTVEAAVDTAQPQPEKTRTPRPAQRLEEKCDPWLDNVPTGHA